MANQFIEDPSFFSNFNSAAASDLMTQQLQAGQPEVSQGTLTISDPILPDRLVADRLGHMDPEIYDLRDTSHLMKLLKVLLGSSGAGGLRKQMSVARMQNAFNGMHFLDLDRFYGALFGIVRTKAELQPDFAFNPYTDATTQDAWDDLHSRDASYRDRLIKFAKGIPYGGSFTGMKSLAEALVGDECDIYEAWDWIDEQNDGTQQLSALTYSWNFLQTQVSTFANMEKQTWGNWGGGLKLFVGRLGAGVQGNRGEWVVHPKRTLALDEEYELVRVLTRFKPAGTNFTVNNAGLAINQTVDLRGVASSSEYWEVTSQVTPSANLQYNPYVANPTGNNTQPVIPAQRPAFSQYQGEAWSYNGDITTASSYTLDSDRVTTSNDDELVVYSDGTQHSYQASDGVMTTEQAIAARLIADGVMTSAAYAPNRSNINVATVGVTA